MSRERRRETNRLYMVEYRKTHPKGPKNPDWPSLHPNKIRGYQLKYRYGITTKQRAAMLEDQDGLCAICYEESATQVDHDRKCCPGERSCGQCVRGMLCGPCNRAIGLLGEEHLGAALEYVNRGAWQSQEVS